MRIRLPFAKHRRHNEDTLTQGAARSAEKRRELELLAAQLPAAHSQGVEKLSAPSQHLLKLTQEELAQQIAQIQRLIASCESNTTLIEQYRALQSSESRIQSLVEKKDKLVEKLVDLKDLNALKSVYRQLNQVPSLLSIKYQTNRKSLRAGSYPAQDWLARAVRILHYYRTPRRSPSASELDCSIRGIPPRLSVR